jgi:hypothetical protein
MYYIVYFFDVEMLNISLYKLSPILKPLVHGKLRNQYCLVSHNPLLIPRHYSCTLGPAIMSSLEARKETWLRHNVIQNILLSVWAEVGPDGWT